MHPISLVLAITGGKPSVKYIGFNSHDAENVFTEARGDAKNTDLALVQNAYPRLTCNPDQEAIAAKVEEDQRKQREKDAANAEAIAAKNRVKELESQLAEAKKDMPKA